MRELSSLYGVSYLQYGFMPRYDIFAINLAMLVIGGIYCKCKWLSISLLKCANHVDQM
jgi:hypothetical protein